MGLTIKELLRIATTRLTQTGAATPRLDAEVILADMLRENRTFFITHATGKLSDERCELYFQLIDRRASGEPVQYITKKQEFMGIQLYVDGSVLIPRPDTETLVEHAIDYLKAKKSTMVTTVLDLCCGSGAIAISLAYYLPKIKVTASDISKEALVIAKINAESYSLNKKIKFLEGNLFEPFLKKKVQFDMIVSNPPYIPTDVIATLQPEVQAHEPRIALDGGKDGLSFYRLIVEKAPTHLKKAGLLLLEIGYDQGEALCKLLDQDGRYHQVEVLQDLSGNDRVVRAELR